MRSLIRLALLVVTAAHLTVALQITTPVAYAGECPPGEAPSPIPGGGTICVPVSDPGEQGDSSPGGNNDGGGGPTKCYDDGVEVPCTNSVGVWFANPGCYASPMSPQPGPDHPAWEGHTPDEGSIYICIIDAGPQVPGDALFFVPNGQAPLVDPAVLAQRALDQLDLAVPEIHIAPDPPLATYVGLETWLWLPDGQWDSLSLTVTAGATSVTVTAEPVRVDWDLTEGTTSCASAGHPWVRGMSPSAQTDCSYTFSTLSDGQPGGKYAVSATIVYSATWTCSGACLTNNGDLGEVPSLTSNDAIEVDERQSVVVQ